MVMTNFRDYEEDIFEAEILLRTASTSKRLSAGKSLGEGGRHRGDLVPTALTLLGTDQ